jgi:antitoxin (DNA-binding transcriptional repressor) of toxin-antitoxin stability system
VLVVLSWIAAGACGIGVSGCAGAPAISYTGYSGTAIVSADGRTLTVGPYRGACPAKVSAVARESRSKVALFLGTTYVRYARYMSENAVPLPYEVQEMTTTEARKHLPELVNMAAYGHVTTVLVRDGRRLARIVPEEDAWVYSPGWQDKLRQAEDDLAAGRTQTFADDGEFLRHLDDIDDEAGG